MTLILMPQMVGTAIIGIIIGLAGIIIMIRSLKSAPSRSALAENVCILALCIVMVGLFSWPLIVIATR